MRDDEGTKQGIREELKELSAAWDLAMISNDARRDRPLHGG